MIAIVTASLDPKANDIACITAKIIIDLIMFPFSIELLFNCASKILIRFILNVK